MNYIDAKYVKTCYDYCEFYWIIDNIPITSYLENYRTSSISEYGSLLGLLPAWSGGLVFSWENNFIWEMIVSTEELNVPILVCEDDCDLSCIVIMVHIRKEENAVYWDRIGVLQHTNFITQEYNQSGILCLEAYSDEDWERYGDNIAIEKYGSSEYWEWVWQTQWVFSLENYEYMVKKYF